MASQSIWFGRATRPLFGWFHWPADEPIRGGVVLCPSIGRDYVQCHYAVRKVALLLEQQGLCVLRFDYDGTGDSAGDDADPGRVEAWLDSIDCALEYVRQAGARSVSLAGMRLGATLAAVAAERDSAIKSLVLWDPFVSGRSFLSEQRALAAMSLSVKATREDGSLEGPGFVYGSDTVLNLRDLSIASTAGKLASRILVLTRAGQQPNRDLIDRLSGEAVEWGDAVGQEELIDTTAPNIVLPEQTIAHIVGWLAGIPRADRSRVLVPEHAESAEILDPRTGLQVMERAVTYGQTGLFGILSEVPDVSAGPTILMLSVATEHHIGPGRLWVELCRHLAARGMRALRVDLSGVGDSGVRPGQPEFVTHAPEAFEDVAELFEAISVADPAGVVLLGLCSSAYQALESALTLRPRGVVALNPLLSFQPPEMMAGEQVDPRRRLVLARTPLVQAFHAKGPLSPLRRRFPRLDWQMRMLLAGDGRPGRWLRQLVGSGVNVFIVCGDREVHPFTYGMSQHTLAKLQESGQLHFEYVSGIDHGLLVAADREMVTNLVTDHLLALLSTSRTAHE